ncbi:MAG TPA: amidohydrolase family protein, partial [Chitinophagaceae bacterium]
LGCTQLRMTPEEAINAVTLNGAAAMELSATHGSIAVGKSANIIITKPMPSLAYLPYSFADNLIDRVMIGGS